MTAGQALTGKTATPRASAAASPAASGTSSASSSTSSSATISANDFLTLLVTEMQNQDPTADTDPNEYINQLVQVNSLEQLISINQTLSTDLSSPAADVSGATANSQTSSATANAAGKSATAATAQAHAVGRHGQASASVEPVAADAIPSRATGIKFAPGNLGIPSANPAANRVAQALSGQS